MAERESGDMPRTASGEPSHPQEELIESSADAAMTVAQRPVSDTLGTGSGCAIGCTIAVLAIIAVAIVLFVIAH